MPHHLALIVLVGAFLLALLVAGIGSTDDLVPTTSACFVAVYLFALAAAVRLLEGRLRSASLVALALTGAVGVFSERYLFIPATAAVLALVPRRRLGRIAVPAGTDPPPAALVARRPARRTRDHGRPAREILRREAVCEGAAGLRQVGRRDAVAKVPEQGTGSPATSRSGMCPAPDGHRRIASFAVVGSTGGDLGGRLVQRRQEMWP